MADLNGSPFCRGLATPDDLGSSLLFATNKQLELLKQATHVYFDATSEVVPALYYQLFTVFVPYADTAFPVFYALMPRKTRKSAYRVIFQKLKDLIPEFAPASAMADFEEASACAVRAVYSDIHVSGCWFHYGQAIVKRLTKMGLKEAYTRQTHVKHLVHCVLGLPLLPPGDML